LRTKTNLPLWGWCLFDVANSSYTTLIITVAFNVVFTRLIVGAAEDGTLTTANTLWAWVLSASWFVVALAGPLLGAFSDEHRARKRMLFFSVVFCCFTSACLYYVRPGGIALAVILVALSNIGFSLSENFISAFLPSLARPEEMGRISGLAWGMGYFGGLISIVLCQAITGLEYEIGNFDRLRWIGPLTAVFFAVASLPALLWLKEPEQQSEPEGWKVLTQTAKRLWFQKDLLRFLISFFFFQGALGIVISFAAIYGEQEVGMRGGWQAAFFITLQLTAAGGAFLFGWLQSRYGGLRTLDLTLLIWIATVIAIFYLKELGSFLGVENLKALFLVVGNFAGLCLGATQACARALVGQMAPEGRSGEVFGFWGFSGKLAMVASLGVFGLIQSVWGLKPALLLCVLLFSISLFIHRFIQEPRRALAH
jgi:MFS transporter, UMF1 family